MGEASAHAATEGSREPQPQGERNGRKGARKPPPIAPDGAPPLLYNKRTG